MNPNETQLAENAIYILSGGQPQWASFNTKNFVFSYVEAGLITGRETKTELEAMEAKWQQGHDA